MSAPSQNPLKRLIGEIHRRSLWQVLAIYVVASWIVFEVVQTLTEGLGLPAWFPSFAFVLLLIGLPIVLATAFVQEGGPGVAAPESLEGLDTVFTQDELDGDEGDGRVHSLLTWQNAIGGGILAFALWGVVAAGWILFGGSPRDAGPRPLVAADDTRPVLAVLPFENLSASEENEYFARGMHEAILTNLARVNDLTVLSRTSVMQYANTEKSVRAIAEELGAAAVMEGSVQRSGDRIRVTIQLIDARSDAHLWADSYDRILEDVFAVQSDVARKVSDALQATLTPSEERRIERQPTESLTAYDVYLKARQAYDRFTREDNDEAVRLYKEAIAIDPSYALAWAGLANAHGLRVVNYGQATHWADSAIAAARRAVELDPELDEAHKALGVAYFARGWIRRSVEANLRAVELNPNHSAAVNNIGVAYTYLGRLDEARIYHRRALRLMPNNPVTRGNVVWDYANLGDTAEAERWLREAETLAPRGSHTLLARTGLHLAKGDPERALQPPLRWTELEPASPAAWENAARIALFARDFETARRTARRALGLNPGGSVLDDKPARSMLGWALVRLGERAAGEAELRAVVQRAREELERGSEYPQLPWELGATHAALGNRDEALRWLERGYEAGYRWYNYARYDPMLDPVRETARFRKLMADMKADIATMRERAIEEERTAGLR
ncbi:MAG: tetratricopeptide repeat protein [Gemmatimonadetes bacterium]|nr:tetratricopeptide repeat protein [Gemmatimonadota bacterium]NIR81051.1 tetratricopeptide repeat protein [Gemmatimonadota bacterium]NIT89869.1 tetratricopeptide repeat protein [Gemmatimonadota bacterium]NIU33668.1 tetratricopeptide repeat protein [Gemmatimonadota bacterium]NIU37911.1 tetratricopeptide repeat protein [Gemmatimonadota bacterium]